MRTSASLRSWRARSPIILCLALLGGFLLVGARRVPTLFAEEYATWHVYAPTVFNSPPPPPPPAAREMVVFDWNDPITVEHHGIPTQTPMDNGDWTAPVNYAEGTIHMRIEIRRQPVAQAMRLQICFWQEGRESCTRAYPIGGTPGAVVTWSQPVQKLWALNDVPIDWSVPRSGSGIVIKNSQGEMVSDYGEWDWSGEDPNQWFPLDLRFTAVVVERGGVFSGWDNYIP